MVKYHCIFSNGNFCCSLKGISVVENVCLSEIQIAVVPFLEGKTHVTFQIFSMSNFYVSIILAFTRFCMETLAACKE